MPHSFPTTEHLHKSWGRPPGLRPTPPSACWRLHDADIVVPAAGRGRAARTRGSALQLTSGPRCRENYVALGESACPTKTQTLAEQSGTDASVCQPGDPSDSFTASQRAASRNRPHSRSLTLTVPRRGLPSSTFKSRRCRLQGKAVKKVSTGCGAHAQIVL
jgi:hypothetical protein